jgi:hypothetical protein
MVPCPAPFFSAARVLQREGVSDETPISMTHHGSSTVSMRSTVGDAARLTVRENDHDDLCFALYREDPTEMPFPSVGVHQGQAFQGLR